MMGPQWPHIDQSGSFEEDRIMQDPSVVNVDIFFCDSHIQHTTLNGCFQFFGSRQLVP